MQTTPRFKQPLCQHSDGRAVPAGRATVAGQPPIFIVHTYERQEGIDSPKKTQLENAQGQARKKNKTFSITFHSLSISFFLYLSIQQSWEHSGAKEKERKIEVMSQ